MHLPSGRSPRHKNSRILWAEQGFALRTFLDHYLLGLVLMALQAISFRDPFGTKGPKGSRVHL